jgi:hypothetical protein
VPGELSAADDLPIHQIPEPISVVGTTDRNFYDRYYFCAHHCSDEVAVTAGLGQYPNLGVADAFVSVTHDGRQDVLRSSREMRGDRTDLGVGAISIEVVAGLQRLDLRIAPNDGGIEGELHWEGTIPAHLEPRHVNRSGTRVTTDSVRFCQTGRWTGHLEVDGARFDLNDDAWRGGRDRSWGIRPVGEPEPSGRRFGAGRRGFLWLYALMQFDDHTIVAIAQEDGAGQRTLDYGARVWCDGSPPETLSSLGHDLRVDPQSRQVSRAVLSFGPGEPQVEVVPMVSSFLGLGTGYGTEPDWRHGMYQGRLEIQRRSFDLADPVTQRQSYGLVDSMARFRVDGREGYGLFEYAVLGANEHYGLGARTRLPEGDGDRA